jgi:hypothetical protein
MAFPAWVQALEKAPRSSAIFGGIGATCVVSGFLWSIMMARGTNTSSKQFYAYNINIIITRRESINIR